MGLDRVALRQVVTVAKNSDRLKKSIKDMKGKVIDKGLEIVKKSGIDINNLPIDVRAALRGEGLSPDTSKLLTPEVICAQPLMTLQQKEETTRLLNAATEQITRIYATTNSIKETVLSLQEPVVSLQTKTEPIVSTINTISDVVQIIKLLPLPTSFPPGAGVPLSVPNTFASTLISLSGFLEKAQSNVNLIPAATSTLVNLLNSITLPLNKLNLVIDPFISILGMVKAIINLQDACPLVTQSDITNQKNQLVNNIAGSLVTIDTAFATGLDNVLEERLTLNATNPYIYKNFRFVAENNPIQEFSFPSRRIKAIRPNSMGIQDGIAGSGREIIVYNNNPTTNPELEEGAYSFASNINVLILEAKFAVDVYTNNIEIWKPPQVRDQVSGSSGILIGRKDPEYRQAYFDTFGFFPKASIFTDPLPSFIRYGGTSVNLNNSPTDIEYGANALISGGFGDGGDLDSNVYLPGSGLNITSFIQSGTIQVNRPVTINMSTFGGIGSSNETGGFTNALLTIKRSFGIQDDINPYTGKLKFVDLDNEGDLDFLPNFEEEYGGNAVKLIQSLYQTFTESTLDTSKYPMLINLNDLNYAEKLEYVKTNFLGDDGEYRYGANQSNRPDGIYQLVYGLFAKTKPLLYNEDVLWLTKRMFGYRYQVDKGNDGDASRDYVRKVLSQKEKKTAPLGTQDGINWYFAARKNAYGEYRQSVESAWEKASTMAMLWEFWSKQIQPLYNKLFNVQTDPSYNGGAWVGGATSIPIIPTNVSADNPDIVISLQANQIAAKTERINEEVGTLDLLGTYTYDLEILDSIPSTGGPEENYPTNFTFFTIEDT
jgi:hypothetical protein